jgi:hypothetical protein
MGERNRPEKSRQIRTILESANIRLSAIRRAEERRKNYSPTPVNQSDAAGLRAQMAFHSILLSHAVLLQLRA